MNDLKNLYKSSRFFRTLIFNSMMSLSKSFFKLTAYMKDDSEFGSFWELIYKEYTLAKKVLLDISGFESLMQNEPAGKASIKAREEIVYDYQFPLELDLNERIPCNCGALTCRGFMNWDLPEKGSKNRVTRTQKRGGNMRDRIRRLGRPLKKSDADDNCDDN